jgi:hypothetical protein
MKIGKRVDKVKASNPTKNHSKKTVGIVAVIAITCALIMWVYSMGQKAEQTVSVVMWAEPIYKNEVITESMLTEYKMLTGEFEKYASTSTDGSKKRRIVLWEERSKLINTYAAYPLQQDTIAMIKDVVTSRTDNSDTVLYSFPGKNIVSFEIASDALTSFKTFLEPGDRLNITAIYSDTEDVTSVDDMGVETTESVDVYREETAFKDIMIADLLNGSGESILDIYASYNEMTTYQQAAMDSSEDFQSSVQPSTLLMALTPEEETLYYQYLSKGDCEFKISLPQRSE